MTAKEIRKRFVEYFENKHHKIVSSAPMVVKDDPTLMFINAGMNQFKEIFLDQKKSEYSRVANSQKCLRVSGKHNDLEEVGKDTYHHTMFEMLGNWSFGDYFKKEAIDMAWELLVKELKVDPNKLYVTVFEGNAEDNTELDEESYNFWLKYLPKEQILEGNKKDNFWEMGNTGPCGPCSEIHIDIRDDNERKEIPGRDLVNKDNPHVIEIWNLVFIQYNRKANGILELLPKKHVDTGMGFERLCMVLQNKKSNYDTDVFQPLINELCCLTNLKYGEKEDVDVAMRVISDHIRAIAFSIADGQLPSNNKAGYVIRRILRRAVRYGYTFLGQNDPFIYKLFPILVETMGDAFPEIETQQTLIKNVIREEENAFLKTLETGIRLLDQIIERTKNNNCKKIEGTEAFILYDTYGFPIDLTELIVKEHNLEVDVEGFQKEMTKQKDRSRNAGIIESDDWVEILKDDVEEFVGYDYLETEVKITKFRKVKSKGKEMYHLVFNITPFYAESGGQVGDTGFVESNEERVEIFNTIKENNLTVHLSKKLPKNPASTFKAVVNENRRTRIVNNHSATHLLHQALREVLGTHVEQKGSLVHPDYLRFDYSHFQKLSEKEIKSIEILVNQRIRKNIFIEENRAIPIKEAQKLGAMALFGEKYGDLVRTIKFDNSIELCGGTHVKATGQIGFFRIINESAIAAGVRRIEAITADKVQEFVTEQLEVLSDISTMLKATGDVRKSVEVLIAEKNNLQKKVEEFQREQTKNIKGKIKESVQKINGINVIAQKINVDSVQSMKDLAFQLKNEIDDLFLVIGAQVGDKANLLIIYK